MGPALVAAGAAITSGLISLFSNSSSNSANMALNAANRKFQHREAELAFGRQLYLTREQNAYNSPVNQKKLMMEAGFNPYNLASGAAGTAVSTSSTNAPQAGSPSAIPSQPAIDPASLSALSDVALKVAQARNVEEDTKKKREETNLITLQTAYQETVNEYQEKFNEIYKEFGRYEKILDVEQKEFMNQQIKSQRDLFEIQKELAKYDLNKMKPAELANVVANTLSTSANEYLAKVTAAKTEEERKYIAKDYALRAVLTRAQAYSLYASARAADAQAALTGNQANLWTPGSGLLYKQTQAQTQGAIRDYNLTVKYRKDFEAAFKSELDRQFATNYREYYRNHGFTHGNGWFNDSFATFWNAVDRLGSFMPVVGAFK